MVNTALYNTLTRRMTGGRSNTQSINELINSKKQLMVATFANLIAQLGITYYVMTHMTVKEEKHDKTIIFKLIGLFLFQIILIGFQFVFAFVYLFINHIIIINCILDVLLINQHDGIVLNDTGKCAFG